MIHLTGNQVSSFGILVSLAAAFVVKNPPRFTSDRTCRPSQTNLFVKPEKGSIVEIDCTLRPEGDFIPEPLFDGIVLDEKDPPRRLVFVLGEGNYLPGLHDLILDMEVGSEVENVSIDAGWGGWNPALNVTIPLESLSGSGLDTSQIKVGTELVMANGMIAIVTHLNDETFVVDANPPLAGASYLANVKLISVELGPSEFLYAPDAGSNSKYQVATVALGCFWGAELAFMREKGVVGTKVGYTQGTQENPTYELVCAGTTGHTEAAMVMYDPSVVSYDRLVHLTMDRLGENKYLLNQVGNDKGTQYRHGIYYHNDEQKKIAEEIVASYGEDCVTEVLPARIFYDAEPFHMQYLLKGGQSARKGDLSTIRCYG